MVHSLFASTDDWDNQLEGTESGWPGFFRTLRIYLTHFRGQRSAIMQKMAPVAGTEAEAWETLTAALGAERLERRAALDGARGCPGAQRRGGVRHPESERRPAAARQAGAGRRRPWHLQLGGPIMVALNLYLYGDQAAETVARETPLWEAWFQERFPMPTEPSKSE